MPVRLEREILWSKRQHFLLLAKSWRNNSTSGLKRRVASDSTVTLSRDGYATLLGELMRPHVSINPEYDFRPQLRLRLATDEEPEML
jgi:hypothetical protein